jgi:hypothetical protein
MISFFLVPARNLTSKKRGFRLFSGFAETLTAKTSTRASLLCQSGVPGRYKLTANFSSVSNPQQRKHHYLDRRHRTNSYRIEVVE